MRNKTEGLIAAPFNPMHNDGSVNLANVKPYVDYLQNNGVGGVFINGTTGEGLSLTPTERKQLAETWRQSCDKLKLIVHVTHQSYKEAGELARHAEDIGADAIGMTAPSFFTPGLNELIDFARAVADKAPSLPFYYYHMPSKTGTTFSMFEFIQQAPQKIETFTGIKFTHNDIMDYQRCLEYKDQGYDILFGRDEFLLAGLAAGAQGAVGSTYNYAAPVYTEMINAFQQGDMATARRCQTRSHGLVRLLIEGGNDIACGKAIMKHLAGIDCGPCRLPLPAFSEEQESWLAGELDAWRKTE
ncbi:MAG: dihydrodipicolinate synthase family protein [Verrucomicrobiota bacterium]